MRYLLAFSLLASLGALGYSLWICRELGRRLEVLEGEEMELMEYQATFRPKRSVDSVWRMIPDPLDGKWF